MPVFNREKLVAKAIESVLNQSFTDWELIVIDDGSTDRSSEVIKSYNDSRIKYHYQTNQERSISRNNGIEKATGRFICFLDSDDYYLTHHLQHIHESIVENQEKIAIYVTGAHVDRGNGIEKLSMYLDTSEHPVKYVFYKKLDMNTVCVHASILEKNKFDPSISIGEDTHLWLRIVKLFPLIQVPFYTTVTVNHATSGMVMYYKEADLKLLKSYVNGALKLFKELDLSEFISKKEQNFYISKKYRAMARSCIWARKMGSVITCSFKAIYWTPSFLFTKEFWNIVKEYLVMMGRILFRKPTKAS